jgi:hypothetical protein
MRLSKRVRVGDIAGRINEWGYREICIDRHLYRANRLAVFYMTGEWPTALVDHVDLNKANDRWSNLRHATHSQNHANSNAHADNTSGIKGVSWDASRRKWQAQIGVKGRNIYLGRHSTRAEAAAIYAAAAKKYFSEFARTP